MQDQHAQPSAQATLLKQTPKQQDKLTDTTADNGQVPADEAASMPILGVTLGTNEANMSAQPPEHSSSCEEVGVPRVSEAMREDIMHLIWANFEVLSIQSLSCAHSTPAKISTSTAQQQLGSMYLFSPTSGDKAVPVPHMMSPAHSITCTCIHHVFQICMPHDHSCLLGDVVGNDRSDRCTNFVSHLVTLTSVPTCDKAHIDLQRQG